MQWKRLHHASEIDANPYYLVGWFSADSQEMGSTTKAYWVEEERAFFSVADQNSFPLRVDFYLEIPELDPRST